MQKVANINIEKGYSSKYIINSNDIMSYSIIDSNKHIKQYCYK